jgi:hypothetical protein
VNANENAAFNRINQTPFFNDPGARQQLNLNDNQFNTLNRAYQVAYSRYNQNLTGLNSSLTEQQRQAQMQQFASQFNNDLNRSLDSTFADPQLRARYDQLNRQYMGFDAFNDSAIQRQLNLTPQQQQQVRQLAAQWRQQLMQLGGSGTDGSVNIDPNQWTQMSSQYWEQLNSVLTPQQQQTWQQLIGTRYNFSPSAYFSTGAAPGSATVGTLPTRRGSLNNGTVGTDNTHGNQGVVPTSGTDQGTTDQGNSNSGSQQYLRNQGKSPNNGGRQGSSNSGNGSGGTTR